MSYRGHETLANKISKKMLTQQKFLKNPSASNTNIFETVSHSIINNAKKCITRTFKCIYVNCFNRLRFLAEVISKLQNMHFLDNLRTTTQEGSMETRQMIPFFSSTFSNLTVCNVHFWIWKCLYFYVVPLWSILVCKIPQFWPKAANSDSSSHFSRK